jgi:hypothetical protein
VLDPFEEWVRVVKAPCCDHRAELGNREDDDSDEETGKARIVVGGESERCEMPQRGARMLERKSATTRTYIFVLFVETKYD